MPMLILPPAQGSWCGHDAQPAAGPWHLQFKGGGSYTACSLTCLLDALAAGPATVVLGQDQDRMRALEVVFRDADRPILELEADLIAPNGRPAWLVEAHGRQKLAGFVIRIAASFGFTDALRAVPTLDVTEV